MASRTLYSTLEPAKSTDRSTRPLLTYLESGRAIAAFAVVIYHAGAALASDQYYDFHLLGEITKSGRYGVEFFFVLSGFIIVYTTQLRPSGLRETRRFLYNRFTRIFPTYWILLLTAYLGLTMQGEANEHAPHTIDQLIWTLFLIPQDPEVVGGTGAPILIVAWSLHYELIFYLLYATWLMIKDTRFAGMMLTASSFTSVAFILYVFPHMQLHYFLMFLFGAVASSIFRYIHRSYALPMICVSSALIFVLLFAITVTPGIGFPMLGYINTGINVALSLSILVCGLAILESKTQHRAPKWLTNLGASSYALYLMHYPLISIIVSIVHDLYPTNNTALTTMAFFMTPILAIIFAHTFYICVEHPIIKCLKTLRNA